MTPGQALILGACPTLIFLLRRTAISDRLLRNPLNYRGQAAGAWIGCTLLLLTACVKHLEFPPLGDPLPASAKLGIPPSIKELTIRYSDSCGQLQEIPLGDRIQEALREGIQRTFKTTFDEGTSDTLTPDYVVQVDLVDSSFDLNKDALYDRAPADLRLNAVARIHDRTGTLLRQTDIKIARRERLRLELLAKKCDYVIEPFIRDVAIDFATRVSLNARLAAGGQEPVASIEQHQRQVGELGTPSVSASSVLRFKAILLDENSNLTFEGGEHVRVRVDIVNTGTRLIENASASLTGTSSVIEQFPAATLQIPTLQPGQTKSLEFIATLSPTKQAQKAVIHVTVAESGRIAALPQTLSLTIQPAGTGTDDVNQIPAPAPGFHQPQTYLVSIGVGAYRDPKLTRRRYAVTDAETVAAYFQSLGGVPPSNIRLLQNQQALRADIHEVLFDWLPLHAAKDAVVIVYFSGQAMVAPTGDILLIPYDGSLADSTRLYPLNDIASAFARLKARQIIFLFDSMVSKLGGDTKVKTVSPRWELGGENTLGLIGSEDFAKGLEDDQHRHGLFTYYLLKGLRGEADTNRNGTVTFGELTGYVRQKVAWAAKSKFNHEQRPLQLPPLKPDDTAASLILTTLPSLTSSEAP
ncbi:MAG: caspase family protein [Nitrospira sp.]|nr:caspase family protein [Nitrospira sp.]